MAKIRRKHLDPESCVMSLGDHLEELRARLILAILGLIVGMVVSLIFGTQILNILEWPTSEKALTRRVVSCLWATTWRSCAPG